MNDVFMRLAIAESRKGFPAPNPHVGCVIVREAEVVGRGHCDYAGGPHAEVAALRQAGDKARGADVYVTLEPCNHSGRTGPCSQALIEAQVKRVVYACDDLNMKAAGGAASLRRAGIEVTGGVMVEEAARHNRQFLTSMARGRPFVTVKAAATLDGRIALPSGHSKWITGDAARRVGHRLRAQAGVVLVGANTVLTDDPQLTARVPGVKNQPLRVVLDPDRILPEDRQVFDGRAPSLHVVGPNREGDLVLPVEDGRFDLPALLDRLWTLGHTGVLVEGGAYTTGKFFEAGLVDQIELFIAPKILGSGLSWVEMPGPESVSDAVQANLTRVRRLGRDLHLSLSLSAEDS